MEYPPLLKLKNEAEYRNYFESSYCEAPIRTFDGIEVRFRKKDFKHCCFVSPERNRDKNMFSIIRSERLGWIKATLEDPNSERFQGWDKKRKRYDPKRRVALVMRNYVVVIALKEEGRADFITAYVANTPSRPGHPSTIEMIRRGPKCA